tara:strand:+ start:10032 stop:10172 length:141 start_codon:yes stop_codon:yes gene_type:complete
MNFIDEAYLEIKAGEEARARPASEEKNTYHLVDLMEEMVVRAEIYI